MVVDVLTIGRSGVDAYPRQSGVTLEHVTTLSTFLGGSPANVAVAAARQGRSAAVITAVGDDAFGRFVRSELQRLGVAATGVLTMPGARTSVTFCELFPPDHFPLHFYRDSPAPELRLTSADIDLTVVREAGVLWLTGPGFSQNSSREAHHAMIAARAGAPIVLDLDYRSAFWSSPQEARAAIGEVLADMDVVVGNEQECQVATGERDPEDCARALLDAGARLAVVKRGPHGALALSRDERVELPALPCTVVNGLGAGDAFGGVLAHGLLAGWGLEHTLRRCVAAGAIVAAELACAPAMPTAGQIDEVLRLGYVPARAGDEERTTP